MTSKKLNLAIAGGVIVIVALIALRPGKKLEDSDRLVIQETDVDSEEVIDDTSRMLDGKMPTNWRETSISSARKASRVERLKRSAASKGSNESPDMDLLEFQRLQQAQIEALKKRAEHPSKDDDGQSLTQEDVAELEEKGVMIW